MDATTRRTPARDLDAPPDHGAPPEAPDDGMSRREGIIGFAKIALFDAVGPLVVYQLFKSQGQVLALILSGIPPAIGVVVTMVQHRRLEMIGVLVIAGVVVGALLGWLAGSPRLILLEGSVPTGIFGLVCVGSLRARRPLMFTFAYSFMGGDGSPKAAAFDENWQWEGFRHYFRKITAIWGIAYIVEALLRVVVVESFTTGTALTVSKVMPYVFLVPLIAYNVGSGRAAQRRGKEMEAQRLAAQAA